MIEFLPCMPLHSSCRKEILVQFGKITLNLLCRSENILAETFLINPLVFESVVLATHGIRSTQRELIEVQLHYLDASYFLAGASRLKNANFIDFCKVPSNKLRMFLRENQYIHYIKDSDT